MPNPFSALPLPISSNALQLEGDPAVGLFLDYPLLAGRRDWAEEVFGAAKHGRRGIVLAPVYAIEMLTRPCNASQALFAEGQCGCGSKY